MCLNITLLIVHDDSLIWKDFNSIITKMVFLFCNILYTCTNKYWCSILQQEMFFQVKWQRTKLILTVSVWRIELHWCWSTQASSYQDHLTWIKVEKKEILVTIHLSKGFEEFRHFWKFICNSSNGKSFCICPGNCGSWYLNI